MEEELGLPLKQLRSRIGTEPRAQSQEGRRGGVPGLGGALFNDPLAVGVGTVQI